MRYSSLLLIIIFFLSGKNNSCFSQDTILSKGTYKNAVSLELLGRNFFYSLNYSFIFNQEGQIYGNIGLSEISKNTFVCASLTRLLGKRRSHFEYGVGAGISFDNVNDKLYFDGYYIDYSEAYFYGLLVLGYKYFNPDRRFVFNVTLTPIINFPHLLWGERAILPWGGVGFGYRFNAPKINFLTKHYNPNIQKKFSLSFSTSVGFTKWKYGNYMENSGFVQSNYLRFKYQPKRLGLNLLVGNTYTNFNHLRIKSQSADFEMFGKNPFFYNIGLGLNYILINNEKYSVSINTSSGIFLLNEKDIRHRTIMDDYYYSLLLKDTNDNISFNRKSFNLIDISFDKKINKNITLNAGYNFYLKRFIPRYVTPIYNRDFWLNPNNPSYRGSVIIYDHCFNIGISYKL